MTDSGLYYQGSGRPVTDWSVVRTFILRRDGFACRQCGGPADQVDHVWPRKHGGEDHVDNLRALCGDCNRRKGDRVDLSTAAAERLVSAIEAACDRAKAALREADRFAEELHQRKAPLLNNVAAAALLAVACEAEYRARAATRPA